MSRREIEKSRKNKSESYTAYEIYQKTQYLLWPVLLWLNETLEEPVQNSKKELLLNALNGKPSGLYFFTPGKVDEIDLHPLSGTVISKAKVYLSHLKKVQKSFKKKFGEPNEWLSRINSRIHFLKNINSTYEQFLLKNVDALPLEEMVFFATNKSQRPSQWLPTKELSSYNNKKYEKLKDIALLQRGVKVECDKLWVKYLKQQCLIPIETLTKIYQYKLTPPNTLDLLSSFEGPLIAKVFEEIRLNGEKIPEEAKYLPSLFSQLNQFLGEPELRACLCRDFMRSFISDETITHQHRSKFFIQSSKMNKFAKLFLKTHPGIEKISFERENFTIFDVFHWFTGVDLKQLKKEIFFPQSFQNAKILNNFEKSFYKKCIKQMPRIDPNSFFKITYNFLSLSKSQVRPASLINILSICREFIPPGNSGNNALEMASFILETLKEQSSEYVDWLSENLEQLLIYTHNKTMYKQFHSPEFEKSSKLLRKVFVLTPQVFNSNLEAKILLNPKYLSALIYISPNQNSLEWIIDQNDAWFESAISHQENWCYVMNMSKDFCLRVLSWSQKLNEAGLDWSSISVILDKIDDIQTSKNQKFLAKHLDLFKRIYDFSKKIDVLINGKSNDDDSDCFDDICSFFKYIDKLENGWQNTSILWDLFFEHIKNYIDNLNSDDFSLYQEENKINWLSCFKVSPERSVELLNIIPVYNYELYEQTLEPLEWLSENQPVVFEFLNNSVKDKESFNRIVHVLKSIKVSLRLDRTQLKRKLNGWSTQSCSNPLEELKIHRKLANFSNELPATIRKIIDLPEKLKSEQKSLTALDKKGVLSKTAKQRLLKVSQWLKETDKLVENIESDLNKILPNSIANAKIDSLLEISESITKAHWRKYSGRPIEDWSDDWRNAIQLSFSTQRNKRILRKLLLNAVGNDFQWIYYHPKNVAFLKQLPTHFNRTLWLSLPKVYFKIGKKTYSVEAERNLLKILQMGNYFDSCLSVGYMNDFSTISNAVEINKHVLWIKNHKGRIVGRKLIVLNQFGELYGFNSYGAALGSKNENPWFKMIFDLYCQMTIKQCGGELQNKRREDDHLVLFSEWYDDGIERFDGWVMDLQREKNTNYISKKVKFKESSDVNLRAALWLKTQNADIVAGWDRVILFQNFMVDSLNITQK